MKQKKFKLSTPDLLILENDIEVEYCSENTNHSDTESCSNSTNPDAIQKRQINKNNKNTKKDLNSSIKPELDKNCFNKNTNSFINKNTHYQDSAYELQKNSINRICCKEALEPLNSHSEEVSHYSSNTNSADKRNNTLNKKEKIQKLNLKSKYELDKKKFNKKLIDPLASYRLEEIIKISFIDSVECSYNYQGNYQNYISRVIYSLQPLFKVNFSKHIKERLLLLPEYNKKKTLILDLDETLMHADFARRFIDHDKVLYFSHNSHLVEVPIFLRPGLFEFLAKVSEMFEILVFTASRKEYADVVLNFLDPDKKIFRHRLYRESCILVQNKVYIKDLSIFVNRKQENIILVDNSFYSFCNQPRNGVLINTFYNDKQDRELANLLNYLQNYLLPASDVREINEQIFNFQTLIMTLKQTIWENSNYSNSDDNEQDSASFENQQLDIC